MQSTWLRLSVGVGNPRAPTPCMKHCMYMYTLCIHFINDRSHSQSVPMSLPKVILTRHTVHVKGGYLAHRGQSHCILKTFLTDYIKFTIKLHVQGVLHMYMYM